MNTRYITSREIAYQLEISNQECDLRISNILKYIGFNPEDYIDFDDKKYLVYKIPMPYIWYIMKEVNDYDSNTYA
jgi:hypothetical protein